MSYWLLKTEPAEWSWQDQGANSGLSVWDGVRNAQAQNFMKTMKVGDLCFFYHTGKAKEIVGIVQVVTSFYSDPSDTTGKCGMVDVKEVRHFSKPVSLAELKSDESIKDFVLFKQPRLSVMPVSKEVWDIICERAGDEGLKETEDGGKKRKRS